MHETTWKMFETAHFTMLNDLEILFLDAALLLGLELDVGDLGGQLEGLLGL